MQGPIRRAQGLEEIAAASAAVGDQAPDVVAKDELSWGQIQHAFELDRTQIISTRAITARRTFAKAFTRA